MDQGTIIFIVLVAGVMLVYWVVGHLIASITGAASDAARNAWAENRNKKLEGQGLDTGLLIARYVGSDAIPPELAEIAERVAKHQISEEDARAHVALRKGKLGNSVSAAGYEAELAAAEKRACPSCGAEILATAQFCNKCGAAVSASEPAPSQRACLNCGNTVAEGKRFCNKCGSPLEAGDQAAQGPAGQSAVGQEGPAAQATIGEDLSTQAAVAQEQPGQMPAVQKHSLQLEVAAPVDDPDKTRLLEPLDPVGDADKTQLLQPLDSLMDESLVPESVWTQAQQPACRCCGSPLIEGARFCGVCGTAVVQAATACASCGSPLAGGEKFCGVCGAPVGAA